MCTTGLGSYKINEGRASRKHSKQKHTADYSGEDKLVFSLGDELQNRKTPDCLDEGQSYKTMFHLNNFS